MLKAIFDVDGKERATFILKKLLTYSKTQKIYFTCNTIQKDKSYFYIYYNKIRPTNKCYYCDSILCKNNYCIK